MNGRGERSENGREGGIFGGGPAQWIREDRLSSCVEYTLW